MRTRVGYAGGATRAPTYHTIGDHTEVFEVDYDPTRLSYADLLDLVFRAHDPTRPGYGTQYQSAVLCRADIELARAKEHGERAAAERGGKLQTRISPLDTFYRAEDYHQKYRLRHEAALTAELVARYGSDERMVDSTLAARLNGLLSGYGKRSELSRLFPLFALSPDAEQRLLARVA